MNALFTTPVKENGEVPPPKKTIGLSFNNLSFVEPLALARFILEWVFFHSDAYSLGRNSKQPRSISLLKACDCRFEEALLAGCNLTQAQAEAFLVALVETPNLRFQVIYKFDLMNSSAVFRLRRVALSNNNLSQLPPILLAEAIVRLKDVDLRSSFLSAEQVMTGFANEKMIFDQSLDHS